MQVLLRPIARKHFERLNEPDKSRVKVCLKDLEKEPPEGDIVPIETDLTPEEIAMIDEGMAEYRKNPASFVPLESIK